MSKLLVMPNNTNIEELDKYTDAYLFGLKDYSVNVPCEITLEELKNIKTDKDIFLSMNRNMFNEDISKLKEILKDIDSYNLKGIFYADTCFINLKDELNIKTPLVWSQEHLTTNYETINFWATYGIKYTYLSGEITKEEIKEIIKKAESKIIVPIFGHLPMFVSARHIVKNYLTTFNLKDDSKTNFIENDNHIYPIIDNEIGTMVYSDYILDGYEEMEELNADYYTLNEFNIDRNTFIEVLKKYNNLGGNYELNTSKGFLYQATIYKVK